jgi:Arrestin (or S-antigen), N-terminal domain
MGNVDSRAKFDSGYMLVMTDKPFYEPGENITGKIYLRCNRPIDAKHIDLEVRGKEKGAFREFIHETIEEPDGTRRMERKEVKRKSHKEIIHAKAPCFIFAH